MDQQRGCLARSVKRWVVSFAKKISLPKTSRKTEKTINWWSKAIVLLDTKNHCSSYRKTHGIKIWSYNSVFFSKKNAFDHQCGLPWASPQLRSHPWRPGMPHPNSRYARVVVWAVVAIWLETYCWLVANTYWLCLAMPGWHRAFVWKMVEDGWKKMSSLFKSRVHRQCWCGV